MHIDGSSRCDDPVKVRRDGHAEQGRQRRARVRMAEVKGAEGGSAGRKTSGLGKITREQITSRRLGAFDTGCRAARYTRGVARVRTVSSSRRSKRTPPLGYRLKLQRFPTLKCTQIGGVRSRRIHYGGVVTGVNPNNPIGNWRPTGISQTITLANYLDLRLATPKGGP